MVMLKLRGLSMLQTRSNVRRMVGGALGLMVFLALSGPAFSSPIVLTPSTPGVLGIDQPGNNNCEPECVYDAFGLTNDGTLELLYKSDVGGSDEGAFDEFYNTSYDNTPGDPSDALLEHVEGESSITCPECFLAIKDGNHAPNYYFYDLESWDGLMDIEMSGFWPAGGAISHVAIWGREGDVEEVPGGGEVPEPGTVLLFGSGLAGLGLWRWRTNKGV